MNYVIGKDNIGKSKHLRDEDFCKQVEERIIGIPIVNKAVLYRGNSQIDENTGILYLNVGEFLCNEEESVHALFKGDNSILEVFSKESKDNVFKSSSLFN